MEEIEPTKDTVGQMATKVVEAEKASDDSQEHVNYFENRVTEQSN